MRKDCITLCCSLGGPSIRMLRALSCRRSAPPPPLLTIFCSLQFKNMRVDYLKAIWSVVNWGDVAARYAAAK